MHAENSVINNCSGREHVEAKSEILPQLDTVAPFALVIKSIHAVDRLTLVVASQQEKAVWVFHLVREHEAYGFNTLLSSVHIVSYEQEFMASSGIAGNFKESEQVEVLSVNISKNFDRRFNVEKHFFRSEYLCAFVDNVLYGLRVELDWFAPLSVFNLG
jgi:hypothetical protein